MKRRYIQTVLGDIDKEELGHCQPHEHIYIVGTIDQHHCELTCINNLPKSAEELKLYHLAGGSSVVDANPLATGRDCLALQDISRLSGVHIIATTGYHIPKFYPENHWIWSIEGEKLEEMISSEIRQGMYLDGCYVMPEYQTSVRAGLIKAAITAQGLDDAWTVKCLTAAGRAARETGASIMVHTEGRDELRMIDFLAGKIGVEPQSILVCHVDRQTEPFKRHEEIAGTGVYMEYDTTTLFQFHTEADEIKLLRRMVEGGFLKQILLSTDPETNRMKAYGASVGIDYILIHFIPLLKMNGFTAAEIHCMMRENPAAALELR